MTVMGSCLCTGLCRLPGGSCSSFPNGNPPRPNNFIGYSYPLGGFALNENEIREAISKVHQIELSMRRKWAANTELSKRLTEIENLHKVNAAARDNIFEFRQVDHKGRDDIQHIKKVLYDFFGWILDNVPENRERSIAIEKLEECAMWLNKSISRRK